MRSHKRWLVFTASGRSVVVTGPLRSSGAVKKAVVALGGHGLKLRVVWVDGMAELGGLRLHRPILLTDALWADLTGPGASTS